MVEQGVDPKEALEQLKMMSRDNVRTPMQWTAEKFAGFSESEPWLSVNPTYTEINVQSAIADPTSILYTYKQLIALRKNHPVMVYGDYHPVMEQYENVVAYTRTYENEKWFMIFNFQAVPQEVEFPEDLKSLTNGALLMCNYQDHETQILRPYEARIYMIS